MKEVDAKTKEMRIRGLSSKVSDGRVIVRDGILLSIRKPSFGNISADQRCHDNQLASASFRLPTSLVA